MQDVIQSDDFEEWFRIVNQLVDRYDLTDSEIEPYDFVEQYINGDSPEMAISENFNFDIP